MAAPSRRDADAAEEVVEFRGATVESALAAARAAQGPDVTVLRAQRVRRGVRGLLSGAEEVVLQVRAASATAADDAAVGAAGAPSSGSGDPVDHALRALLARNDHLDVDPVSPTPVPTQPRTAPAAAAPDPSPAATAPDAVPQDFVPQDLVPEPVDADIVDPDEEPGTAVEIAPQSSHPAPGIGTHRTPPLGDPEWDVASLHAAGLPLAVCRRLPEEDPGSHPARVSALAGAIAAVVPSPCPPGPAQAVALSGYGPEGALALVQAGASGVVPDRLYLDGGPVRATAHALAKGVLACVPR